jgi:hypothetical protein
VYICIVEYVRAWICFGLIWWSGDGAGAGGGDGDGR